MIPRSLLSWGLGALLWLGSSTAWSQSPLVTLGDNDVLQCDGTAQGSPGNGYGSGILVRVAGNNAEIRNCVFLGGVTAIELAGAGNVTIVGNRFGHPDIHDRAFTDNLITGTFQGSLVLNDNVAWTDSTGWNNAVLSVAAVGTTTAEIDGNLLWATAGIFISGSVSASITHNVFRMNPGIKGSPVMFVGRMSASEGRQAES